MFGSQSKPKISLLINSQSKSYTFDSNFQTFNRLLSQTYQLTSVDDLSLTSPDELIVIAGTCSTMSRSDVETLKQHLTNKGKLLLLLTKNFSAEMKKFLNDLHLDVRQDIAINQTYQQGLYNPAMIRINPQQILHSALLNKLTDLDLIFENVITIQNNNPELSTLVITPDSVFPSQQPIVLASQQIVIVGSADTFTDKNLKRKSNFQFLTEIINFLHQRQNCLNLTSVSKTLENQTETTQYVVDTESLANNFKPSLQNVPDENIFWRSETLVEKTDILPQIVQTFKQLNLQPPTSLKIINPAFERPTTPLQPAVQQPSLIEPPMVPQLPLYDLDNCLASDDSRLARLANKYGNVNKDQQVDIEKFILQCGEIFQIEGNAYEILSHCLNVASKVKQVSE